MSENRAVRHHNDRWEQVIAARPAARAKAFRIHTLTVVPETYVRHTVFTPGADVFRAAPNTWPNTIAQRPEFPRAVFREASSKMIAWSTPARLAGNILGPARKPLVLDLDERWNSVSCKVMKW